MNIVETLLDAIRRAWARYKLQSRKLRIEEMLREALLDQEALDSAGHGEDADALIPFITAATLELRDIESQLRAIGA